MCPAREERELKIGIALYATFALFFATSGARPNERWHDMLGQSSKALRAGDYKRARKISSRLVNEMVEMLGPGPAAAEALAIAVTHKALANAGLSNADDALWYWHVAIALHPNMVNSNLSMFGAPGEFLKAHLPQPAPAIGSLHQDAAITAPKVLKRVEPDFPPGAEAFGVSGSLTVECILDEHGHLTSPRIVTSLPAPTLSFAALEAVRRWRFEPAKVDGVPVPIIYTLTVNYKLP
jgi:TonB family protein